MDHNDLRYRHLEVVTSPSAPPRHLACEPFGGKGEAGSHPVSHAAKGKGRLAFLLGISGTVVSAVGLIALTLFQQYNDCLNELRRDLKHFNEASADLVKKDNLQKLREKVVECLKEVHATAAVRAQAERELQAGDRQRKEMEAELQRLRERLASVEGRQAATPILIPAAAADPKGNPPGTEAPRRMEEKEKGKKPG
jgi:septal ring factor EnvC (AmiA/AmiB activator)